MKMNVLGILELKSIADGLIALDGMVKAAPVSVLKAEVVNPGKYLIIVYGDVASVDYAMERGRTLGNPSLIDHLFLKNIDEHLIEVLLKNAPAVHHEDEESLGILETLSVASCIEAADLAVKATGVKILKLLIGNELGGKAVLSFSGTLGEVEDAMHVIVTYAEQKGQLYRNVVLTGPHADMRGFVYGN